jgi:hypothetical protein
LVEAVNIRQERGNRHVLTERKRMPLLVCVREITFGIDMVHVVPGSPAGQVADASSGDDGN